MSFYRIGSLISFCALAFSFLQTIAFSADSYEARVAVPVADLRKEPADPGPKPEHDPLQESQLLYGEPVRVLREKEGWSKVEAVEQREWTHSNNWEGYPGWVRSSALAPAPEELQENLVVTAPLGKIYLQTDLDGETLSLPAGSRLAGMQEAGEGSLMMGLMEVRLLDGSLGWIAPREVFDFMAARAADRDPPREGIVKMARQLIGENYYWGGRSVADPESGVPPHRGVDCSGLVQLAYQVNDHPIPRDSHEQWMKTAPIKRGKLKPADLIFFSSPDNPKKITHVMLYAGNEKVIEGPGTGQKVREADLESRIREAKKAGRKIYYGTYFP